MMTAGEYREIERNPTVIIEVLPEFTETCDRGSSSISQLAIHRVECRLALAEKVEFSPLPSATFEGGHGAP
jgi:hypothetical protein